MRRRQFLAILIIAAAATAGCSRAVRVGSDSGQAYRLEVRNLSGVDLIVRYDAGRGNALLGSVANGATDYFRITSSDSATITVTATAESGSRTSGPYTVSLVAGGTAVVTLR